MNIIRRFALACCLATSPLAAQGVVTGVVIDSLGRSARLRGATVVLVELSRYATTDSSGRFRFDSVPDGQFHFGLLHAVLDSLELSVAPRLVDVGPGTRQDLVLATPSAATAYRIGCAERVGDAANADEVMAALRARQACLLLGRRAAQFAAVREAIDSTARGVQSLAPLVVRDSVTPRTWFSANGFHERQRMGLGAFLTPEAVARFHGARLEDLLSSMRGVRLEQASLGPAIYLRGGRQRSCRPAYFIDGALYSLPSDRGRSGRIQGNAERESEAAVLRELSQLLPPERIKAVELYGSSAGLPSQFDFTMLTGCGSIVIWTH